LQESEILCGSDLWNDSMDNTESSDSDWACWTEIVWPVPSHVGQKFMTDSSTATGNTDVNN
jgi:hypothetical protein